MHCQHFSSVGQQSGMLWGVAKAVLMLPCSLQAHPCHQTPRLTAHNGKSWPWRRPPALMHCLPAIPCPHRWIQLAGRGPDTQVAGPSRQALHPEPAEPPLLALCPTQRGCDRHQQQPQLQHCRPRLLRLWTRLPRRCTERRADAGAGSGCAAGRLGHQCICACICGSGDAPERCCEGQPRP